MMDKDYYPNSGIPLEFETIPWNEQSFLQANSSVDHHYSHFESTLSSIIPNLGNSIPLISADPGFAERAAKFSCFGSRSLNGRESQFGVENVEFGKLGRISSSPSLNRDSLQEKTKNLSQIRANYNHSNEESSVSEQILSGETGSKTSNEMSSRKRKGGARRKCKENGTNSAKGVEVDEDANAKRSKSTEIVEKENSDAKSEDEPNDVSKKDANLIPPEAPKDYIHVRARRGQATDSHSLAERVRREKISERMKLLQDLVPGCNKVTGKALMLDEIINYVQSLQRQVEFLSMKLASVNPGQDFKMENLISKDMYQPNATVPQQMYHLDPSLNHLPQQNVQLHNTNISDGFDVTTLPQFPAFSEDDLHSIVQMGFGQNPVNFHVLNQTSDMKVER